MQKNSDFYLRYKGAQVKAAWIVIAIVLGLGALSGIAALFKGATFGQ